MTIEKTRIEVLADIFDEGYRNAETINRRLCFQAQDKAKFVKLFIEMEGARGKRLHTPVSKYLYEKSSNGCMYTNYHSISSLIRHWAVMKRKEQNGFDRIDVNNRMNRNETKVRSQAKKAIKTPADFSVKCLVSFLKENNPEALREFIAYTIDLDRQQKIDSVFDSL